MKIQCNVCEAAEAKVLCCADEAALCWECDEKVHAANKLASKHQRVLLSTSSSSSQMPNCDICQEAVGYFFCLEDRALLCRKCDVAIHTANTLVSSHQRFLLTGVEVGLEPAQPGSSMSSGKSQSGVKLSEAESRPVPKISTPVSMPSDFNKVLPAQFGGGSEIHSQVKASYTGGSAAGSIPQWQVDEYFGFNDYNQNVSSYMDHGSSKADSGKFGDSDCSSLQRSDEQELDQDDCLGEVPEISWMVPQMAPTATGLYWPKDPSDAAFVPDISSSPGLNLNPSSRSRSRHRMNSISKRRRRL